MRRASVLTVLALLVGPAALDPSVRAAPPSDAELLAGADARPSRLAADLLHLPDKPAGVEQQGA
ncbi:MAG TPA: hypothetical protein VKA46_21110 [Gemmataceae bacterium]|nr:hypothetical protein [Gemmataceae bacterium]